MESTYAKAVGLAIPVFLLLIGLELILDRLRGARYFHFADSINSLSCGMVSTGLRVFFGFLGLFTYQWVLGHWALAHPAANHWATWLFAFVLYDLCYYWQHRLGHTVGLFWASHVVHHQSEEFNLTTALRQPATGVFTNWIFYVPLALAGVPITVFLLVGVTQLFYQFWPHTRLIGRLGVLDHWIQTPSNHRVHHAQNEIYLDRNYVGVFLIWDHLFGSFQEELDQEPPVYGIRGPLRSWNPMWANLHYYWSMAQDCWHARRWADKLRVWIAPPGWRPADVAARFPKPHRDFERYDPARPLGLTIYVLVQFGVLLAANSHFLAMLPKQAPWLNLLYFIWIVATLVILGGLLENRREFAMLEAARLALTVVAALAWGAWFGGASDPRLTWAMAAFAVASLAGLWWQAPETQTAEAAD